MRKGDTGAAVADLQRRLIAAGLHVAVDGWYGEATVAAVEAFQARAGLVADGQAGPKTLAALAGNLDPKHLSQQDLEHAAADLGVPVAAIMAVNDVESRGRGFLDDGRPVILFERHVLYRQLAEAGADAESLAARYPAIVNRERGGYAGGAAEWARLATARQVSAAYPWLAEQACSWGQYQIMGYHWQRLGYATPEAFVAAMRCSEAHQLAAFVSLIQSEPALLKALKARKWDSFARLYNGPDYRASLYDVKLARAYERFSAGEPAAA